MRGLFSAGVMDVFMEHGIIFDGIVGVSAGAAFGCNYKSMQPGRAIRYNKRFAKDPRYCGLRSLLKSGDIFNAHFAYHVVPVEYDKFDEQAYESNPVDFHVVCTDVLTGKPVYKVLPKADYDTYKWIRASASMPVVSKVVKLDGYHLLDGGISDSIPLKYFEEQGYDRCVVILTQPLDYVKHKSRMLPLLRWRLRRYPQFVEAFARRPEMYNAQTAYVRQREAEGSALVIRPDAPLQIGHIEHDACRMQSVYDIGRRKGEQMIEQVKGFVG